MDIYTAKEMTEILKKENDEEITLRKVRYYAQRGMLPERELIDGKLVYTEKHLNHLRMIRAMKKTGKKLENIKGTLGELSVEAIDTFSRSHYQYIQDFSENFTDKNIENINGEIQITFSSKIENHLRNEIVSSVKEIYTKSKGDK